MSQEAETSPATNEILGGLTESEIRTKLETIKEIDKKEFEKIAFNDNFYVKAYGGSHWEIMGEGIKKYDGLGNELWVFAEPVDNMDGKPKRVINKIFPQLNTEAAIIMSTQPTVVAKAKTLKLKTKYHDQFQKLNLFLREVFNTRTDMEFFRNILEVEQFGRSPIMLYYDAKKSKAKEVPFFIKKEDVKKIMGDPNVDSWSDVKWAQRKVTVYTYEVNEIYDMTSTSFGAAPQEDNNSRESFDVIELDEIWIRGDALSVDLKDEWYRFVEYNNKYLPLKKTGDIYTVFPVLPIEIVRMYIPPVRGWHGISEIDNIWEMQKIINKRASQEDYHITYLADPACEVDKDANAQMKGKEGLWPGKMFAKNPKRTNTRSVEPITVNQIAPGTFQMSADAAERNMNNITGVEDAAQGKRGAGVYSAKLFQEMEGSIQTRLDMKIAIASESYINIAKKAIEWAKEDLGSSGKYEIYDPDNDKTITIGKSDFESMEKFSIELETMDAALLSKSDRLNKLNEIKQYNPQMDYKQTLLSIEAVVPGFFPPDYIDQLQAMVEFDKLQVQLQIAQASQQLKQIMSPPAPQPTPPSVQPADQTSPETSAPVPETPALPPQNSSAPAPEQPPIPDQPTTSFQTLDDVAKFLVNDLKSQGKTEVDAENMVAELINRVTQTNPGLTEQQYINLLVGGGN